MVDFNDYDGDDGVSLSRDELLMERFLEGKLHVGSSMVIKRNRQNLSFALSGTEANRFDNWWKKRETHPNQRTVNARLIILKRPVQSAAFLSRDLEYRRPPFDRVLIVVTPAELLDITHNRLKSSSLKTTHNNIKDAPSLHLHDMDRSVGHMNLLQLVSDTIDYQRKLDKKAAEKAASWRPFITPRRPSWDEEETQVRPTLRLPVNFLDNEGEGQAESSDVLSEAHNVAMEALLQQQQD